MPPSAFARKFQSMGACQAAIDWCESHNVQDFRTALRTCPTAEHICWGLVRVMGLEGTRAAVACVAAVAQLYADPKKNGDPNLRPALDLCGDIIAGKSQDLKRLQVLAYDLSAAGLASTKGNGAMLISASYAAYAVTLAAKAAQATAPAERDRALVKASSHAADSAVRAWYAAPGLGHALAQVAREAIKEDAALKAWAKASGSP